jgi:anhydro-N-acetylmuramic acid kinase
MTRRCAPGSRTALDEAAGIEDRDRRPGSLGAVEKELTERHAAAVAAFLEETGTERAASTSSGFMATRCCTGRRPG